MIREKPQLQAALLTYAKDEETIILGGDLPGSAGNLNGVFEVLGLPWKYCGCRRPYHHRFDSLSTQLPPYYSMKSVLEAIPDDQALYRPVIGARAHSLAFQLMGYTPPAPQETPIAARVGKGLVGYIGDVNAQKGTTPVTLALFGVGDVFTAV